MMGEMNNYGHTVVSSKYLDSFENKIIKLKQELKESNNNHARVAVEKLNCEIKITELKQQKEELINLLCERCDYIGACEVEEILCAVSKYK